MSRRGWHQIGKLDHWLSNCVRSKLINHLVNSNNKPYLITWHDQLFDMWLGVASHMQAITLMNICQDSLGLSRHDESSMLAADVMHNGLITIQLKTPFTHHDLFWPGGMREAFTIIYWFLDSWWFQSYDNLPGKLGPPGRTLKSEQPKQSKTNHTRGMLEVHDSHTKPWVIQVIGHTQTSLSC